MTIAIKILGPYPSCTTCELAEKEAQKVAKEFLGKVTVEHLDMLTAEFGQYKGMVSPIILVGNDLISTGKVVPESQLKEMIGRLLKV
jgi:hypothetical protein